MRTSPALAAWSWARHCHRQRWSPARTLRPRVWKALPRVPCGSGALGVVLLHEVGRCDSGDLRRERRDWRFAVAVPEQRLARMAPDMESTVVIGMVMGTRVRTYHGTRVPWYQWYVLKYPMVLEYVHVYSQSHDCLPPSLQRETRANNGSTYVRTLYVYLVLEYVLPYQMVSIVPVVATQGTSGTIGTMVLEYVLWPYTRVPWTYHLVLEYA
jgi:hypothetical protein